MIIANLNLFFNFLYISLGIIGLIFAFILSRFRFSLLKGKVEKIMPRPHFLLIREELASQKLFFISLFLLFFFILTVLGLMFFTKELQLFLIEIFKEIPLQKINYFITLTSFWLWLFSIIFCVVILSQLKIIKKKWQEPNPGVAFESYFASFILAFFWLLFWVYVWLEAADKFQNLSFLAILVFLIFGFLLGFSLIALFKKGWLNFLIGALNLLVETFLILVVMRFVIGV
jgi:hypothetical protein